MQTGYAAKLGNKETLAFLIFGVDKNSQVYRLALWCKNNVIYLFIYRALIPSFVQSSKHAFVSVSQKAKLIKREKKNPSTC